MGSPVTALTAIWFVGRCGSRVPDGCGFDIVKNSSVIPSLPQLSIETAVWILQAA
jgi:hypothetical protein